MGRCDRTRVNNIPDERIARFVSGDGRVALNNCSYVRLADANSGAPLATFLDNDDGQWLTTTPEGFFAASAIGSALLGIVRGLEAFSVDQFYANMRLPDAYIAGLIN